MLAVGFHVYSVTFKRNSFRRLSKDGAKISVSSVVLSLECGEHNEYYVSSCLSTNEWNMYSFVND